MKEETKNKIAAEAEEFNFGEKFPAEIEGFKLKKIFDDENDKFNYFSYENAEKHCGLTAYYHEETFEYKVRIKIGLTEFCLTDFFTDKFSDFDKKIYCGLESVIKNLSDFHNKEVGSLVREKKIIEWKYGADLPRNLEGFELFISPAAPVEFTNGSYIIINYCDFEINSDFIIYYNIYNDEFTGESRINGVPNVSYDFDSQELVELENKLKEKLSDELKKIRGFNSFQKR